MDGIAATFAQEHFGAADLGDERLNARLLSVADQLAAHPSETFPKKFHSPADLQAFYRLMENKRVTHAKVMMLHTDVTLTRMRATPGVVLLLHDTTVLDYSGLESIEDLGQIGDGHGGGCVDAPGFGAGRPSAASASASAQGRAAADSAKESPT
jgi:hypothetical protein